VFESLKLSTAGDGLEVKILMMPLGKDRVMSPVIFTMHLKSHLKKKIFYRDPTHKEPLKYVRA